MGGLEVLPEGPTPDATMRRPHVYERTVPRARRDAYRERDRDSVHAAQAILRAVPGLTDAADSAGLATLADLLEAVRREAERVVGDGSRPVYDAPATPQYRDEPE